LRVSRRRATGLSLGVAVTGQQPPGDSNSLSSETISSTPAGAMLSNTYGDMLTIS
jgi:hypothetical protein